MNWSLFWIGFGGVAWAAVAVVLFSMAGDAIERDKLTRGIVLASASVLMLAIGVGCLAGQIR